MENALPTPSDLSEYPELAALVTLRTNLEVAALALISSYPESSCGDPERTHTEREAYANSILHLIDPLVLLLDEYTASVERLRTSCHREAPGLRETDVPSERSVPF